MGTIAKPQIKSVSFLRKYFLSNPLFLWGIFLDVCMFPLALLMYFIKWMHPKDLDESVGGPHDESKHTVVLVHGSGANEAQWLINRIHLGKRYNVYSVQLNEIPANPDEDINVYVERLREKIEDISKLGSQNIAREKLILIGHSMGGLVVAKYAQNVSEQNEYYRSPDSVITIGTPWRGAPALGQGIIFDTVRHHQMTPGSKFLSELKLNPDVNYFCFGGKADLQVPLSHSHPEENCEHRLEDSKGNVLRFSHLAGHTSALFDITMWKTIHRIIDECVPSVEEVHSNHGAKVNKNE